tara:strand:- start:805 stop:1260 length:456 start_codon:yes stop_codon:yes gene_type:complete
MAIVNNTIELYEPQFCIETSRWVDKIPFERYSRNKPTYRCPCNYTFTSKTNQAWETHFNTKTHKLWISHYGGDKIIIKEKDAEIKQLRIRIGEMEKIKIDLEKKNLELQNKQSQLIGCIYPIVRMQEEKAIKEQSDSVNNIEKLNLICLNM